MRALALGRLLFEVAAQLGAVVGAVFDHRAGDAVQQVLRGAFALFQEPGAHAHGVRIYPGNYYFESVSMGNSDRIFLRTFTDAERSISVDASRIDTRSMSVQGSDGSEPVNPNSDQAGNANVRTPCGARHVA